jgi:hypothetical protein
MCTKNETVTVLGTVIILGVYVYKKKKLPQWEKKNETRLPLYYVYKKRRNCRRMCTKKRNCHSIRYHLDYNNLIASSLMVRFPVLGYIVAK